MKKLILIAMLITFGLADTINLVSGVSNSSSVSRDEMKVYKIHGDAGKEIAVIMDQLQDDADLYVKIGVTPTRNSYDCRSIQTQTRTESCNLNITQSTNVYIGVFGYRATSYRVKATLSDAGGEEITSLTSGVPKNGSVAQGETKYYKISAHNGDKIVSLLDHLNDDADIYVRMGSQPTATLFDCKSTHGGTTSDGCDITLNRNTNVYLGVYGYRATSYQLKATKIAGGNSTITLTSGVARSGSVAQGETKFYKISAQNGDKVVSLLDHLNADADIYVKVGSQPTASLFDCKSTHGGTTFDSCDVTLNRNTNVYVAVYGYRATTYQIKATKSAGNGNNVLTSGVPKNGSVAYNAMKYYKIHVGANKTVDVVMDQLTADADLYVQVDSKPLTSKSACKSTKGGTNREECKFSIRASGDIHIGILGFRASDYRIKATITTTPNTTHMLENAESGHINPNWTTIKGDYHPQYFHRPNLAQAPAGTGVIAFPLDSGPGQVEYYTKYELTVNDSIHKVLEIDLGGLPNRIDAWAHNNSSRKGYIIHYGMGVEVETLDGTRRMDWDSFYTHHNTAPHFGVSNWLEYPSPTEMVRGFYISTNVWNHFRVDLEQQLKLLEPNNRITKVNYFFTLGGVMDNIKLVTH